MRRRRFISLTSLGAIAAGLLCVGWIRSYRPTAVHILSLTQSSEYAIGHKNGAIILWSLTPRAAPVLQVPYWMALFFAGAPPVLALSWHVYKRSRSRPGHCASCGYDLRATPDRCPECGAQPVAAAGR